MGGSSSKPLPEALKAKVIDFFKQIDQDGSSSITKEEAVVGPSSITE